MAYGKFAYGAAPYGGAGFVGPAVAAPLAPIKVVAWFAPELAGDVPVGSGIRTRAQYQSYDTGAAVDPDIPLCHVKAQYQTTQLVAPVKDAVGAYRADVTVTQAGRWRITWLAQSNPGAVATGSSTLEFNAVEAGV